MHTKNIIWEKILLNNLASNSRGHSFLHSRRALKCSGVNRRKKIFLRNFVDTYFHASRETAQIAPNRPGFLPYEGKAERSFKVDVFRRIFLNRLSIVITFVSTNGGAESLDK